MHILQFFYRIMDFFNYVQHSEMDLVLDLFVCHFSELF